ncbi:hypothetical protein JTZ62_04650 [Mammaliicoccus sciuri]|uniref:hypothetical protein n=1 Tax=Mammaliicoccus sciuri TaxID=1296 RepID=UPI0019D35AE6|nr:hypothetical protein [Mammaliicoccus sciuri]QSN68448.1 hypothetical protein JTZ62_04650 [Mammaliicoccus sciuri]UIU23189.1 hypothetical protein LLZ87_04660 [Mammaliicoccus sciuri]UIU26094.1 hypothetical protein LLZ92_04660 [Mammaliicoccus sciuri]
MTKFIVIKPRGSAKLDDSYREIEEYDANSIPAVEAFIEQHVGKNPVSRKVGDYLLWISNPNIVEEVDEEEIEVPDTIDLTCNLLINEFEFAFGGVVVTANLRVTENQYEGLNEQDVANIMNVFSMSDAILVEDPNTLEVVAVDRVFDALLSPNGISEDEQEEIEFIPPELGDDAPEEVDIFADDDGSEMEEIEFEDVDDEGVGEWIDIDDLEDYESEDDIPFEDPDEITEDNSIN